MAHTLECGYSYMAVVGFDAGDPFYDTLHGKLQVMTRMHVVDEEGFTVFLNSLNLLLLALHTLSCYSKPLIKGILLPNPTPHARALILSFFFCFFFFFFFYALIYIYAHMCTNMAINTTNARWSSGSKSTSGSL